MDDQRTDRQRGKLPSTRECRQARFYSRLNPTLIAVMVFLITIPAWLLIASQVYAHGIVFWNWPMSIGPVSLFMYCVPGEHKCVTIIPELTWILDLVFLPTRFGLVYLLLLITAMFAGFKSTFIGSWQRKSLWLFPAGAVATLGCLIVGEKLGF
jgi:hypothetical protein